VGLYGTYRACVTFLLGALTEGGGIMAESAEGAAGVSALAAGGARDDEAGFGASRWYGRDSMVFLVPKSRRESREVQRWVRRWVRR
jgi:hypothetical protein